MARRSVEPEGASVTGRPVWLDRTPEPIFAVLHAPPSSAARRVAALMLPTFGWDNDCSYRARRAWATRFAEAGITTARIDFPGTENSAGPTLGPNRVGSWIDATVSAAQWLREYSRCDRLVSVGTGLGGMLAYEAIAAGAPIDDMVLWSVRASGRTYVRELRAFSAIASGGTDQAVNEDGDEVTGLAGYAVSAEMLASMNALQLTDTPLPNAPSRRVLLLGRDANGVDRKLERHLREAGAAVTAAETDDYHLLTEPPEFQRVPRQTIALATEWVLGEPSAPHASHVSYTLPTPIAASAVNLTHDGHEIREQVCEIETPAGRLIGVLSVPSGGRQAPYCLVLTNAGALRHTGPSRMLVEIARAAAAAGIPAVRVDLPGLGDSEGTARKTFERNDDDDAESLALLSRIYDYVQGLGIADRFVPAGLCSAAYFALLIVPADARSVGAVALNPPTLRWGERERKVALRGSAPYANAETAELRSLAVRRVWDRVEQLRYELEDSARSRLARSDFLWRTARRAEITATIEVLNRLGATGAPLFLHLGDAETLLRMFAQPKVATALDRW
ncbi:MAG: alpha/beta hydrolase, partial [Acidobacteriota bacterium]|nr:alpha/beta hydrolase [Acidobacteriota bacterium]